VDNRQRRLDLALIASDRLQIAVLAAELPHAGDDTDGVIIRARLAGLHTDPNARLADVPPYTSPSSC
jgi:hypothetical protein